MSKCIFQKTMLVVLILVIAVSTYAGSKSNINEFAVDIFKKETASQPSKNVFISPFSIHLALSMAYNGAVGDTKTEMAKAMRLNGISVNDLNNANVELIKYLKASKGEAALSIANSIWGKYQGAFLKDFEGICSKYYNSEVYTWSKNNPEKAINSWVDKKTRHKIPTIIDKLPDDAIAVLLNAIYFNGKWQIAFKKKDTKKEDFTTKSGSKIRIPLMKIEDSSFRYFESPDIQVVSLNYKNSNLSAYFFLPAKSINIDSFVSKFTSSKLNSYISKMNYREGTVKIPKIKTEYESTLNNTLKFMGMKIPFDKYDARFDKMSSFKPNIYISDVIHKTYLEMNEKGTEAAAVTAIVMMPGMGKMAPTPRPFYFSANRPYMLLITDSSNKVPLFMGVIRKP